MTPAFKKDVQLVVKTSGWGGNEIIALRIGRLLGDLGCRVFVSGVPTDRRNELLDVADAQLGSLGLPKESPRAKIIILPTVAAAFKLRVFASAVCSPLNRRAWIYAPFWGDEWLDGWRATLKWRLCTFLVALFRLRVIGISWSFFRGKPLSKRMVVFPNVPVNVSHAVKRDPHGQSDEPTRLVCIGRISFIQKRQDFLVTAVDVIRQRRGNWCRVVFQGDGVDVAPLRAMIGVHSWARLLPWTEEPFGYRWGDICVVPSAFEGLPLVALEAIATGIPVVCSHRSGLKSLVDSRCHFQCGDTEDFERAIDYCRTNYERLVEEAAERLIALHSESALVGSLSQWVREI